MARNDEGRTIRPSLLDRLIDEDPGSELDAPQTPRQMLRQLRLAIRRDLENLLNTRIRCLTPPAGLEDSVLEYGIPDLTAARISSDDDQEDLLHRIAAAIRLFEPRFKSFEVIQKPGADRHDRSLRFQIEARVYAEPTPEDAVFDSAVEPVSRAVEVKV